MTVFGKDGKLLGTLGKKAGETSSIVQYKAEDAFQFFGFATQVTKESDGPFQTLTALGVVNSDTTCLQTYLTNEEKLRKEELEKEAADKEAERVRLAKEAEELKEKEGKITRAAEKSAEEEAARLAAEKAESNTDSSGAVITIVVILVLAVIAGILIFIFRKQLNLKCQCCKRADGGKVESVFNEPDSDVSSRSNPMKSPMRVSFKEDATPSVSVTK